MRSIGLILLAVLPVTLSGTETVLFPPDGPTQAAADQGTAPKQVPGPPGTIRVRVRLVPVDVIVTDGRDQPVSDLKQEDFQIFENGRRQQIGHFTVQKFEPMTPAAQPSAAPSTIRIAPVVEPVPQSARTFLILLGRGRHQQGLKAVDALIQFVRQDLLPQDRVAVFAYNRATDFTTNREEIVQVLERYKKFSDRLESWLELNLSGFRAVYGAKELPKSLEPEVAKIFDSPTGLASRQVPPGRLTEDGKIVKEWEWATGIILGSSDRAAEAGARLAVADDVATSGTAGSQTMQGMLSFDRNQAEGITLNLPFDEFAPRAAGSIEDMQNLFTCIEYLRYMDGEKHLLFFSGRGLLFPYGNTDYDKGIGAVANDARVAIDTFHTGGLAPTVMPTTGVTLAPVAKGAGASAAPPPPTASFFSWGDSVQVQSLRNISAITGGRISVYKDIADSLAAVNESTRVQYLLGYYPSDENWDGRYRRIDVRVNRPGLKVLFRRGYFARDKLQPYDRAEFLAYSRISAAAGYPSVVDDVPFKIETSKAVDESGQPQLKVDLKIDAAKVKLTASGGRLTGRLRVAAFYADGSQRLIGEIWKTVDLNIQESNLKDYMKSGIPFSVLIPTKLNNLFLTVVVYDMHGDKVGSRRARVEKRLACLGLPTRTPPVAPALPRREQAGLW